MNETDHLPADGHMQFVFRSLGSSSSGNATVVQAQHGASCKRLLIDAGFTLRQLEQRLARHLPGGAQALDAIFITHEHSDHIGCGLQLAARYDIPIYMSAGTWRALNADQTGLQLHIVRDGDWLELGAGLAWQPFTVPHDANEPLQLRCKQGARELGILTDLGHASRHVMDMLASCQTLLLECNHDLDMLRASSYPPFLKDRIASDHGHLRNSQSVDIINTLTRDGSLQSVVAAHLSERNNRPELVEGLLRALDLPLQSAFVACPIDGTDWIAC